MDKNVIFHHALQKIVNYQDRNPLEFDSKFKLTIGKESIFVNHLEFYTAELEFLDYPSYSIKIYTTVDAHSVSIDYCCGDNRNYTVCFRIILKRNDDWYIDDFYHWSHIRNKDVIYSMIETSVNDFKIFKKGLLNHVKHHVSKC